MADISPSSPGLLNWGLVNLLGLVWGTSFVSIGISLESFSPISVAAIRTSVASIALLIALPLFGQSLSPLKRPKALIFVCLSGVIGLAVPFSLLAWGQQFVPSSVAGVAMGSVPLLLVPLVYFFSSDEDIGPRRIIGILIGFIGLLLIVGPGLWSVEPSPGFSIGAAACICAALGYAIASIITRNSPKIPTLTFATGSMTAAALVLVPIVLVVDGVPSELSGRSVLAIVYLGLLPTAIATVLRVRVITTAGSLFMSITAYLVPCWSVLMGIIVLGEEIPAELFAALGLILFGIAMSQWRSLRNAFYRSV